MRPRSPVRFIFTASLVAIAAASAGGCSSITNIVNRDVTGSVSPTAATATTTTTTSALRSEADWRKDIDVYGARYRNNPKDSEAALHYGTALRATGQRAQAVAVLEQAAIANPSDRALLAAYGRSQVDNGNYQQGFEKARRYYNNALKIKPDEPSVLSNLGMSYLLSKQLANAEQALRRAYEGDRTNMRIRQNLALAIGLQGRVGEAESIVAAGLPPDAAAESVSALKQMLPHGDQPAPRRIRSAETARS
jgi:Flp pilus assembly protein TadD